MPRLTILMPVYNGAEFLRETMDSVLNQTFRDFEFLIINDGSTDNTKEIIFSFDDNRIKYMENESNIGYVRTLNIGLDHINTQYVARMDADDLWEADKLTKQIRIMDANPEIGICGTSIRKFGAIEGDFIFPVDNEGLRVGFLFYCKMSHPSVVFRTSFINSTNYRYRVDYCPAEDYKMWVDSIDKTQIYNIPEILVHYRQHPSQVTQTKNPKQVALVNAIRVEMLEKVSPDFTSDEKQFHNDCFINGTIKSNDDYRRFMHWSKILQQKNRQSGGYLNKQILKQELNAHIQARYKYYIMDKYFKSNSYLSVISYLISMDWRHLGLKRNIKIILQRK